MPELLALSFETARALDVVNGNGGQAKAAQFAVVECTHSTYAHCIQSRLLFWFLGLALHPVILIASHARHWELVRHFVALDVCLLLVKAFIIILVCVISEVRRFHWELRQLLHAGGKGVGRRHFCYARHFFT